MSEPERRLFVSGIPVDCSEDDVKKRFGAFGPVSSLEKIVRRREGFPDQCFAYLNISISDSNYHRCLSMYNKAKWKGSWISIQPAKEKLLSRLEAERNGLIAGAAAPANTSMSNLNSSTGATESGHVRQGSDMFHIRSKDGKKVLKVDSVKNQLRVKRFSQRRNLNTDTTPVANLSWHLATDDPAVKHDDPAASTPRDGGTSRGEATNQKRLRALQLKQQQRASKPQLVVTPGTNSRVVFQQDDEEAPVASGSSGTGGKDTTSTRLNLFASDSDEEEEAVDVVRPQFEGEQGAKLFKLQQQIGWDRRFEVNETFLSSDNEDVVSNVGSGEPSPDTDEDLHKEQQRNISLINKMFGNISPVRDRSGKDMQLLRYDPSAIGSELLEREPAVKVKKKVKAQDVVSPKQAVETPPPPVVSRQCYYDVHDSLHDVLQTNGSEHLFSFATTGEDKQSDMDQGLVLSSGKTPSWLHGLERGQEVEESIEQPVEHSTAPQRTLFFFHTNCSELSNRMDDNGSAFHCSSSAEQLQASWPQTRALLKQQYKQRRRDAIKWLRQRKRIH